MQTHTLDVPKPDAEANVAAIRRFFDEVVNEGRLDVADELFAADFDLHAPLDGRESGPAGVKQFVAALRAGFRDLTLEIDEVLVSGDKVVVRWHTVRQTHTGPYRGIPPTGRRVRMSAIEIFRLDDGRIAEAWLELDALGGVRDMGVVPPDELSSGRRALFVIGSLFRFAKLEAQHALRSRRPA